MSRDKEIGGTQIREMHDEGCKIFLLLRTDFITSLDTSDTVQAVRKLIRIKHGGNKRHAKVNTITIMIFRVK